jgi:hypothetical protein
MPGEAVQNLAPWLRMLRGREDEEIFELERKVADTIASPGWEELSSMVEAAAEASLNELRFLQIKDHASLARDIGWGAGVLALRDAAQAVQHEAEKRRRQIRDLTEQREAAAA